MSEKEKFIKQMARNNMGLARISEEPEEETFDMAKAMTELESNTKFSHACSFNDFKLEYPLGFGTFGRIHLAREKKNHSLVALKAMVKKELQERRMEEAVTREIEIQSRLNHPNICQLLYWFHDDFRVYLALEYASKGDLFDALRRSPGCRFDEHLSAKYIYQLADAVNYCHQNDVIHRDIKLENIFLTITGDIKLADFGWSIHAPSQRCNKICGTLEYFAPEIVKGLTYDQFIDHWCLGVVCYEFLVGSAPFYGSSKVETFDKILKLAVVYPSHLNEGAKDLIQKLLVLTPGERMNLPDVMGHPWVLQNM